MERAIEEHVTLRVAQQIGPSNLIREYQALRAEVGMFVGSLIGTHGVTANDAFDVMRQVDEYVSELIRRVVAEYVDGKHLPQ